MGGKRKKKLHRPANASQQANKHPEGFWNAYIKSSENGTRPIEKSMRANNIYRKAWERVRVGKSNQKFNRFFRFAEKEMERPETMYDLHRELVYDGQTKRLQSTYSPYLEQCSALLDIGCGSGELMRRIVRTDTRMNALEQGNRAMAMLGIDLNSNALSVASLKRDILFEHHPELLKSLSMEFLLMDLIDLRSLDLKETNIAQKQVDAVLATDVFRWILRSERMGLLKAIREKIKETGYLLSMEFSYPHLPPGEHLPAEFALRMLEFPIREHMRMTEFFDMAEEAGFSICVQSIDKLNDPINDEFPALVSAMFRPRMERRDALVLAFGNDRDLDSGFGSYASQMLCDSFEVYGRIPDNEGITNKYLIILGLADIKQDFVLTDNPDGIEFHDKKARIFLDKRAEGLQKQGTKIIVGVAKQTESEKSARISQQMEERFSRLILEISERWR